MVGKGECCRGFLQWSSPYLNTQFTAILSPIAPWLLPCCSSGVEGVHILSLTPSRPYTIEFQLYIILYNTRASPTHVPGRVLKAAILSNSIFPTPPTCQHHAFLHSIYSAAKQPLLKSSVSVDYAEQAMAYLISGRVGVATSRAAWKAFGTTS